MATITLNPGIRSFSHYPTSNFHGSAPRAIYSNRKVQAISYPDFLEENYATVRGRRSVDDGQLTEIIL